MNDYLTLAMWLSLSNKLRMNIEDTKEQVKNLALRYDNDIHFKLSELSVDVRDALLHYVAVRDYLKI